MISPIDRFTSLPMVSQAVAVDPTTATYNFAFAAGAGQTAIRNVPSIFAHSITIFVQPTVAITNVTIRRYAANRQIQQDTVVIAAVGAGVAASVDSVGTVGETYDILFSAAAPGTLKMWTVARQT
jgi:hypothetical protein